MKTGKITRFLALCLALISLSMMVAGILGMRSAVKDRKKDDAEIQDIQNKIDDYRELSATLTDTENYKSLSDTLEEKQKQYNSDMSRHKTELATYTATNGGLQMGLEALAQAKAALQAGKIQIEMYEQLIDRYRPVLLALEPLMQDIANLRELLIGLENDLAGNANGSLLGSIQDAETGIDGFQSALNAVIDDQWVQVEEGLRQYLTEQGVPAEEIEAIISAVPGIWNNGGNWDELLSVLNELADQYREQNLDEEDDGGEDSGGDDPVEDVDIPNDGNGNPDGNGEDPNDGENASGDSDDDPAENDGNIDDDNTDDSVKGNIDDDQNADAPASLDSNDTGFSLNTLTEDGGLVSENSGPLAQASSESGTEADQQTNIEHLPDEERITSPKTGDPTFLVIALMLAALGMGAFAVKKIKE